MENELTYDFDLLHERYHAANQRGGLLVLPLIHLSDTSESFEQRRAAVEDCMLKHGIEFDVVLAEFVIIMAADQYVQSHAYITGHLVQRGGDVSIDDSRTIAIGVCKAVRGVMSIYNEPATDGVTMLTSDKAIIHMTKSRIQFRVDDLLDAIQREFTRREGNSSNLILVFLGVVIDEEEETENI